MPRIERGPLQGFYAPDYDGGSTVNLLASIIGSRGGTSPHRELEGLPAQSLRSTNALIYLVLDGLGYAQLQRHLAAGQGQGFFAKHPHRSISTVFPATTAAAVTTFDTGASVAEHGILSWYLHLPDLGSIATVLRTTTRLGTALVPDEFDLRAYFGVPSHLETITVHRTLLSYGDIIDARFGRVGTLWPERHSYFDLDGMVASIVAFADGEGPRLAYAYWPKYDALCHEFGCDHDEVVRHFDALDGALARLTEQLAGKSATLLVLADHGLVDVARDHCIDLATVPGLMDCLAVAPSGDQRQVSCFVRPSKVESFQRIYERHLADACVLVPGELLLEHELFGPGRPHPSLPNRLGDYVLLSRDDYAMIYTPPGFAPFYMPGSHGGMSQAELEIPLYAVHGICS